MTFTEIVFEIGDDRYPLCNLTAAPSGSLAVVRVLDVGRSSGRFRTVITFYGTESEANELTRSLRAYRSGGELEVVSQAGGFATVRTESAVVDAASPAVRLVQVLKLLDGFGPDVIVEPFLVRRGRIRARVLVPRRMDTQRALLSLQDIQRSSGFNDFRIVRVAQLRAERYVDLLARILTPEQEELLRLAASMGYYSTPKGATLEHIAAKVGLSVSPVHKRLKTIEEILIGAHVDPSQLATGPRRRRRRPETTFPATAPCEITLRVRWPQSRLSAFCTEVPGARALIQPLHNDQGVATFLLVVLASDHDYPRVLEEFEKRPDLVGMEMVDRDRTHASAKVRLKLAATSGVATFPFWDDVWGFDATTRPFIFEGEDVVVRALLLRPLPEAEIRARFDRCAKLAGWSSYEIMAVRAAEDGRAPLGPPDPPTARQEEVLKIAHALGYYRTPRACTLENVAATLGVSANAIHKNLSSAEAKVIAGYLSAGV